MGELSRPIRALVAASLAVVSVAAAVAVPLAATASSDAVPGSQPPVPIDFCDFASEPNGTQAECRRELIAPADARVVDVEGEMPPASVIEAAGALSSPPPADSVDPLPAFGTGAGATGPSAHAGLTSSEAQAVFEQNNEVLLTALAAEPIPADAEVLAAGGDGAVIHEPGVGTSVIDSSQPLVTGPAGRPIDLDVAESQAGFEPARPAVEVELPQSGYQSAKLTQSEIGLAYSPEAISGEGVGREGRILEETGVFYPRVDTDTDLFLAPKPSGFELFAQLRSAASPEELRIEIELPAGASVHETDLPAGGAEVVGDNGDTLALISPPYAADANGETFPAEMRVEGGSIILQVAHRGTGAAYPILVDPEVSDVFNWPGGSGFNGWYSGVTASNYDSDYVQYKNLFGATGLWNTVAAGKHLTAGSLANWYYLTPHYGTGSSAYISDLYMAVEYSTGTTTQDRPRVAIGMYEPTGSSTGWVRVKHFTSATALIGRWFASQALDPAWQTPLQMGMTQQDAHRADFQLYTTSTATTPSSNRSARISNAHVKLDDTDQPSGTVSGVSGWVDGSAASHSLTSYATDGGLGVKTQTFVAGQDPNGNNVLGTTQTSSCAGTAASPCPRAGWNPTFSIDPSQLRDGLQASAAGVFDVTGKGYINGRWWGLDRTEPSIDEVLGRPLQSGGGEMLRVEVSDGDPGGRDTSSSTDFAGAGSGVVRVELRVDDSEEPLPQHVFSQPCLGDGLPGGDPETETPWGSCGAWPTFSLEDLPPGQHVIDIVATDRVGNTASQSRTVSVAPEEDDEAGPSLSVSSTWVEPGTGDTFDTGYPDDGHDPYLTNSTEQEVDPGCNEPAVEPNVADPYNNNWDDPCDFDSPASWFDTESEPVPPSKPDLVISASADDVGTGGGAGSGVGLVELRVDEEPFGSACYQPTCSWTLPRSLVLGGQHDIVVSASDNSLNRTRHQVIVDLGKVLNPALVPASSTRVDAVANGDVQTGGAALFPEASVALDPAGGISIAARGAQIEFTPQVDSVSSSSASLSTRGTLEYGSTDPTDPVFLQSSAIPSGVSTEVKVHSSSVDAEWGFGLADEPSEVRSLSDGSVVLVRPFPEVDLASVPPAGQELEVEDSYLDDDFQYALPDGVPDELLQAEQSIMDNSSSVWGDKYGALERSLVGLDGATQLAYTEVVGAEPMAVVDVVGATDATGAEVAAHVSPNSEDVSVDFATSVTYPVTFDIELRQIATEEELSDCVAAFRDDPEALAEECFRQLSQEEIADLPAASQPGSSVTAAPILTRGFAIPVPGQDSVNAVCLKAGYETCKSWRKAATKAKVTVRQLYKAAKVDSSRANLFRHMFWVSDMINRTPEQRGLALNLTLAYEWFDQYDAPYYNIDIEELLQNGDISMSEARDLQESKRASQQDALANYVGFNFTSQRKAEERKMPYFCFVAKNKAQDSIYLGPRANVFKAAFGYLGPQPTRDWTDGLFRRMTGTLRGQVKRVTFKGATYCKTV